MLDRWTARWPAGAPLLLASAGRAAAAAAVLGLLAVALPLLAVWVLDPRSGSGAMAAARTAGQVWLLAHHTGLDLGSGQFGLVPLGLTAMCGLLLGRAAMWAAQDAGVSGWRAASRLTGLLAGCYAGLAAAVASLSGTAGVRPLSGQAAVGALLLALVAGGTGAARGAGLLHQLPSLPSRVRVVLSAAAVSATLLIAAGALLVGAALLASLDEAAGMTRTAAPGLLPGAAVLVVQLAYVPTAVMWGTAAVIGPGFTVGTGTTVSADGVLLGPLPPLPLLAALPGNGPTPAVLLAALAVPLLAGLLAGVLVGRRLTAPSPEHAAGWGLLVGVVAGVALAGLAGLTGGPAGPGRFAVVGPSPWQVGLLASLEIGLPAAATAWWLSRSG